MKKKIIISVLAVVGILLLWGLMSRNSLINKEENVRGQWANVENQYQRRADLIPNLVNSVKGYASHENSTLIEVMNARSKATQVTVSSESLTAEKLNDYRITQNEVGMAIGKLLMVAEAYPDLKANQNFLELQAQLEGTENRIATERGRYNRVVNQYNASIRKFPTLLIAKLFGFNNMPYFEAADNSDKVQEVNF